MTDSIDLGGWIKFPKSKLPNWKAIKKDLSYKSPFPDDEGLHKVILCYRESDNYLEIPRCYMEVSNCVDKTTSIPIEHEFTRTPNPNHPKVKNPEAQAKFMDDLYDAMISRNNVLASAVTGSGKTVCALSLIPKLKQKTIILVHTDVLKDQWIAEIESKLGIPKEDIGIIQASKNTSEGKLITISLIQTLARRESSLDLFNSFGFVILDEAHRIATEFFNDVVAKFSAKYRLALTATPNKRDGSDVVLYRHFGQVSVLATSEVMDVTVYVHNRYEERMWGKGDRAVVSCLSKSYQRNEQLIAHIVKAYKKGRKIIAVSNSVTHIQSLIKKLSFLVDPNDMGQLTATKKIKGKTIKTKKEELDLAKTKRIILATDGLVREGLDIPDLTMGIDLVPFYNATQRIGRVRRYLEGKKNPYWITFYDTNSLECTIMYNSRLKDYKEEGFKVVEYEGQ
jgi:superfamily II DNA or RNA helicase